MVLQRSVKSEDKVSRKFSINLQSSFEATPENHVERECHQYEVGNLESNCRSQGTFVLAQKLISTPCKSLVDNFPDTGQIALHN